jgi:hypothetical protein
MATNQLLTISMITAESARVLGNNLALTKCVNRNYDDEFAIKGAKIGQNVNVRKPARYLTRTGSVVDIQAQTETYAQLTFYNPIGVDLAFTSQELTFSLDMFSDRVIKPAVIAIANQVEALGFTLVDQVYNAVGTPGTPLTAGLPPTGTAMQTILDAAALLYDNDAPVGDGMLHEMNGSRFNSTLSASNLPVFNPQPEIGEIYVKGMQGEFAGAQQYMNQLVPTHTTGTYGGTPVVNGTNQSGGLLITNGWTATTTTLNVGDIFTIDNVYAVNPQTQSQQSHLQQFVVTVATVTDGSGNSTIAISPAIVGPGSAFQNVSVLPTTGDVITVLGASTSTSQLALMFHRDAFMLANQELVLPRGVEEAAYVREEQSGVGLRVVSQFDIRTNQHITRFDVMVAYAVLYPQLACRIYTT